MPGHHTCRLHPPGSTTQLATARPGRPAKTGHFLRYLGDVGQAAYEDSFGDVSPLHALALIQAKLAEILARRQENDVIEERFMASIAAGSQLASEEDGTLVPVPSEEELLERRVRQNRKQTLEDYEIIQGAERAIKAAQEAVNTLAGKRLLVEFPSSEMEEEVRRGVERFVGEFLSWVVPLLCVPCRQKVSESLLANKRTTVVPPA